MTREDLNCIHEPFGDAFYFGPERLSERYADDAKAREESGFATTTFADVVRQLEAEISKASFPGSFCASARQQKARENGMSCR
jgi:hypothetical protein